MALLNRPQPPAETPAQRYARDYSVQQGDWQNDVNGNLVYSAPDSGNGRRNRTVNLRGGDVYYTYDVNGAPVEQLDANGRNEREYVDLDTGDSAHAGAGVADRYSMLKGESDAPTNFRSTGATATTVDLAWDAVAGAESYRLREGGTDVAGALALTGTTFTHTGRTASTTYNYTVSVVDRAGNRSEESGVVTVTTPAA